MDLTASLRELFGFPAFRPGQREACEAALRDRDVMVVMPTGSGKSLCYQLPALLRDDLTVVVSPLVALMQDQVEALADRGLGDRVALVNAQRAGSTNAATLRRAATGELRLLYVAPERFAAPRFLYAMAGVRVGLFVVDEAHCVSQWGHDFRPDYFRLADAARMLGAKALVASTATATQRVAHDVVQRLGLRDPLRVATGFDRPNIAFAVARPGPGEKRALLAEALKEPDALPAIVYAGTRAGSEELARERARVARGLLPGGGPRRARRAAGARAAAGREPRQGAARALHQARRDRRGAPGLARRPALGGGRRRRPLLGGRGGAGPRPAGRRRSPSLTAGPPHAGAGDLALAVGDGPRGRPRDRAVRPEGRRAVPVVGRGGRPRALAPIPRDMGGRGAGELPARSDPAALRGFVGPGPPGGVLRRVYPRSRSSPAAARPGRHRDPRRRDHLGCHRRQARGRTHHLRGDPPRRTQQEAAPERLRRPAGLRRLLAHAPG